MVSLLFDLQFLKQRVISEEIYEKQNTARPCAFLMFFISDELAAKLLQRSGDSVHLFSI
jgi:hypothetical protein